MFNTALRKPQKFTGNNAARQGLYERYSDKLRVNPDLTRQLVSFQANKKEPFYRWFKFKEAFSSQLVEYCLRQFHPQTNHVPRILDPFAGAGTTLTTAARFGWQAVGIELLPVGIAAIKAHLIADRVQIHLLEKYIGKFQNWKSKRKPSSNGFTHLSITHGAFPKTTERAIASYMEFVEKIPDKDTRYLFWFACLAALEDISYTRKDGQYLRWDSRARRMLKSSFNKGEVLNFREAIGAKLGMMRDDIIPRNRNSYSSKVKIFEASCLDVLPEFSNQSFDMVLTSPPYCNRYDYTRTYALELAFLGYDDKEVKSLRQNLLSATVENKSKKDSLFSFYEKLNKQDWFRAAIQSFECQMALQEVLNHLFNLREQGKLNNSNIPNMVENYFLEMTFVIHGLEKVLSPGGKLIMINDNVQYHGEEVPVDLILSDIAAQAGFHIESIWVLPRGKGNSSQQMGVHGRKELRKCIYVWSKPS